MKRSAMLGVHRAIAGCVLASALLSASSASIAQAEPAEARLEYARGAGAERCPDEATLRSAVSTRLGYDPFRAAAPRTIAASIARAGRSLRAEVKLLDASGAVTGSRELTSSHNDCSELLTAMALAISIAIDPNSDLRASPVAPPATSGPASSAPPATSGPASSAPPATSGPAGSEPPVTSEPSAEATKTSSPDASSLSTTPSTEPRAELPPPARTARIAEPPRPVYRPAGAAPSHANASQSPNTRGLRAHAGVAGLVTSGTAPGQSLGLAAIFGMRSGSLSAGLEGRADLRTYQGSISGGVVSSALLLGTITACYHYERLLSCALGSAGVLRGEGSLVAAPKQATTVYTAAGARVGAETLMTSPFSARVYLDLTVPLTPTRLELNGSEVWHTARAAVAVGVAGLVHFL